MSTCWVPRWACSVTSRRAWIQQLKHDGLVSLGCESLQQRGITEERRDGGLPPVRIFATCLGHYEQPQDLGAERTFGAGDDGAQERVQELLTAFLQLGHRAVTSLVISGACHQLRQRGSRICRLQLQAITSIGAAAAGLADDEPGGLDHDVRPAASRDALEQGGYRVVAVSEGRVAHRGQGRRVGASSEDVVEADGRHVLGDAEAGVAQGPHGADAGQVIAGHHGAEQGGALEDERHGRFATGRTVVAVGDEAVIDLDAGLQQRLAEGFQPLRAVSSQVIPTGHEGDASMAVPDEMVQRLPDAAPVVDHHLGAGSLGSGADDGQACRPQILDVARLGLGQIVGDDHQPICIPRSHRHQVCLRSLCRPDRSPLATVGDIARSRPDEDAAASIAHRREDAFQEDMGMAVDGRALVHRPRGDEADDGPPCPGIHQELPASGQDRPAP